MADRWSNPSGGLGVNRFRVWPAGSDSYDHSELTANWDELDEIIGIPASGTWPPNQGINGGIYKVTKDLQDTKANLASPTFTGSPLSTTPPPGDSGTRIATTAFVSAATAGAVVAYGTTLPGSPTNGQEYILVDSTTNPTWQWRLRYNSSSSSAFKWEYIGGTDFNAYTEAGLSHATGPGAWEGFVSPTTGPTLTVPRSGEYELTAGCYSHNAADNGGGITSQMVIQKNGSEITAVYNYTGPIQSYQGYNLHQGSHHMRTVPVSLAAGDILNAIYYVPSAGGQGSAHWSGRRIAILPRRVI